ncbi:MAG: hypothetical protein II356_06185, partial [Clostridia bacterium]|nr:hypothetical protein [Clostridia bacterium]
KDYLTCIKNLALVSDTMVFTNVDKIRGEKSEILASVAEEYCSKVLFCDEAERAYKMAFEATEKNGALIVAGSFYLAAFVRGLQ